MNDKREDWERIIAGDNYFDCKNHYTEDLRKRREDGCQKDENGVPQDALASIGVKSGIHQGSFRFPFFDIAKEGQNWSMLEIGCGYGAWAAHFCQFVKEYVGVDISLHNVEKGNVALKEAGINNATLKHVCNCNLDFLQNEYFDLIFTIAVFIHTPLEITRRYLELTYSKLKKGGRFLHHFNMCSHKEEQDWSICGGIDGRETHVYTEEELKDLFRGIKLKILDQFNNKSFAEGKWMRYVYGVKE